MAFSLHKAVRLGEEWSVRENVGSFPSFEEVWDDIDMRYLVADDRDTFAIVDDATGAVAEGVAPCLTCGAPVIVYSDDTVFPWLSDHADDPRCPFCQSALFEDVVYRVVCDGLVFRETAFHDVALRRVEALSRFGRKARVVVVDKTRVTPFRF